MSPTGQSFTYKEFAKISNDSIIVLDRNLKIIFSNIVAQKMFNRSSAELDGKSFIDISSEEQPSGFTSVEGASIMFDSIKSGEVDNYEWLFQSSSEKKILGEISITPMGKPEVNAYHITVRDVSLMNSLISQHIKQADKHKRTSDRLHFLYNLSQDLDNKSLTNDIIANYLIENLPALFSHSYLINSKVKIDGYTASSKDYKDTRNGLRVDFTHNEKKYGFLKVNFVDNSDNIKKNIQPFHEDEIELLKAVAELVSTKLGELEFTSELKIITDKYKMLMDAPDLIMVFLNTNGVVIEANNWAINLLSKDGKLAGLKFCDMLNSSNRELCLKNIGSIMESGIGTTQEIQISRNDKQLYLNFDYQPLRNRNGEIHNIVCIGTDITKKVLQERQNEEIQKQIYQASRLVAIGELSAGVSHELNTPLAVIQCIADEFEDFLEENNIDNEEIKGAIESIHTNIEKMGSIINQLKAFGRGSTGEIDNASINKIIESSFRFFGKQLDNRQINYELKLTPKDIHIKCDPSKLEQVFINLIINSRDFLEGRDSKIIEVTTEDVADLCMITFKDNGPGIDPMLIDNIFDPFVTTKKQGEGVGSGMGLSVVYGIITEHKGTITASNIKEGGVKFTISLPMGNKS